MSGKYSSSKKKIKRKKILSIVILLVVVLCIIFVVKNQHSSIKQVEGTVNDGLKLLKENKIDEVNNYLNYSELIATIDDILLNEQVMKEYELDKYFFSNLNWKVNKIDIDGNEAFVTIEITNKDFEEILTNWMKELISQIENGNTIDDAICIQKLKDCSSDSNVSLKTVTGTIMLKNNNGWSIVVNTDLRDVIFPGIDKIDSIATQNE